MKVKQGLIDIKHTIGKLHTGNAFHFNVDPKEGMPKGLCILTDKMDTEGNWMIVELENGYSMWAAKDLNVFHRDNAVINWK